jgi:hypothetical protein
MERARMMPGNQDIVKKTETFLRQSYTPIPKNESEEAIVAITNFLERYVQGLIPQRMILEELTRTIHRVFGFQYVCIALRDRDGRFRYKTSIGLTSEAMKALFEIAYSDADLFDESTYPSTAISDITRFYMAEGAPYTPNEVSTFSRPQLLGRKRSSPDDMIEGDYFNVFIKGSKNEVLGYLELGVTRNGKLPARSTLSWLEVIARLLAIVLSSENV